MAAVARFETRLRSAMEVMAMIGSSPFSDVMSLRQAMDQLVNESFVGSPFRTVWSRTGTRGPAGYTLPLDVYTTENEAVIVAAVPGLRPEDLQVSFYDGTLVLSGTIHDVSESDEAKGATWYLHELGSGQFQRAVRLPFEVNADQAEAIWEHGIVRIVLPKAEQAKPKTIQIKVGSGTEAISAGESGAKS